MGEAENKVFIIHFYSESPLGFDSRTLDFESIWEMKPKRSVTRHQTSDVSLMEISCSDSTAEKLFFFRKRYWYPGFKKKIRGFFRNTFFGSSRAAQEFKNLVHLTQSGISEVKPIAYGEHRLLRFLARAFILTEYRPNTCSLDQWFLSDAFQKSSFAHRRRFASALGRWLSRLHGRGYRDRDLYARNILMHSIRGEWRFSKIDSPKGSRSGKPPGKGSPYLKDLKDLDYDLRHFLSRTERLRCLLAYSGASEVDHEVRRLIAGVLTRKLHRFRNEVQ
jgi:hypothetical protein